MKNLTYSTTRQMSENTSTLRELQWRVENWERTHNEAKAQEKLAWDMYVDAIDDQEPPEAIEQFFNAATMFEAIRKETWREWEKAKARLLALSN